MFTLYIFPRKTRKNATGLIYPMSISRYKVAGRLLINPSHTKKGVSSRDDLLFEE